MLSSDSAMIWLYDVPADRADDFQAWFDTINVPAVLDQRPELRGRWQVLRANAPENGVITFGFIFDGVNGDEWELQPLLEGTLGREEAKRRLDDLDQIVSRDYGWAMTPVLSG